MPFKMIGGTYNGLLSTGRTKIQTFDRRESWAGRCSWIFCVIAASAHARFRSVHTDSPRHMFRPIGHARRCSSKEATSAEAESADSPSPMARIYESMRVRRAKPRFGSQPSQGDRHDLMLLGPCQA